MENNQQLEHAIYKITDEQNCDAHAFAFLSKDKFEKVYFKFPELQPNEIRANVLFSGVCLSDSSVARGKYYPANYPLVTGHEIIAEVSLIGSEVTKFKIGEKVAYGTVRGCCENCKLCKSGSEVLCKEFPETERRTFGKYWGGFATQIQQPDQFFFKLPNNFDLKRGAPLLCAGLTVYKPIYQHIRKGDRCAVLGIGGLGHLAVLFLAKLGFEVVGITTSDDKNDLIKQLGGTPLNLKNEDHLKLHQGKIDFIINTLPTLENFDKLLTLVAPKCKIIQVGAPSLNDNITISPLMLLMNELEFIGSAYGGRDITNKMLEFCAKENVYPMVEEFSFDDFPKALNRLEHERPKFRCVVNVEDYSKNNNLFK